ncbi:MAG: hypothetical protein ACOYVD_16155 [Bacillota bacterium]
MHVKQVIAGLYQFVEAIREVRFQEAMEILCRDHLEAGQEMALKKIP